MTEDRTNQFTDEQVEAAARAHDLHYCEDPDRNEFDEHCCAECGYAFWWPKNPEGPIARRRSHAMSAALEAAAGVVLQAESEDDGLDDCPACDMPISQCSRDDVCCEDCNHSSCWPPAAPVQPSSTVDEIADVLREAHKLKCRDGCGIVSSDWPDLARAVVEAIGGESR